MTDNAPSAGPQRFRKLPVEIEAMQLAANGEPSDDEVVAMQTFLGDADWESDYDSGIAINTLEGTMRADPGDWIIRGVKGELYPCKPDIFAATYAAADGAQTGPGSVQPFKTLGEKDEHDPVGLALAKATEQFRSYAKDHTRKAEATRHSAEFVEDAGIRDSRLEDAQESDRKAKVNSDMADMMDEALLAHTARLDA